MNNHNSTEKTLVTILMAGYQSQINMLKKSLDSIKEQTYPNFESELTAERVLEYFRNKVSESK